MAGLYLHASTGPVALAAAGSNKVFAQINVPANHRIRIQGVGVFIQGVTVGDAPCLLKVTRSTAGTTPSLSGGVLAKKNNQDVETPNSAFYNAWVTPPAAGTLIEEMYVHPQTGIRVFYPTGHEIMVSSDGTATLVAFELTTGNPSTGTPNATVEIDYEE